MNYPKNAWYVAATSAEIDVGRALGRTLLSESVTLYRSEDGVLAAVQSTCPHRFAPLHQGKVRGRDIECPYHGLRFGPDGKCVHNPHGSGHVPPAAQVKSFAVVERDGLAWIWMGDAALSGTAPVPSLSVLDEFPPQARVSAYLHTQGGCDLMTDNIMDLSHSDFLHPGSLSTGGEVASLRPNVDDRGDHVVVSWRWRSPFTPPVFRAVVPPDTTADLFLEVTWRPVALMFIRFGVESPSGGGATEVRGCHFMTPETDRTSHYFFNGSRNFMVDNAQFTEMGRQQLLHVFGNEDKPIIEAVQRAMGDADLLSLDPIMLAGDAGALRVRRKVQAMVQAELA